MQKVIDTNTANAGVNSPPSSSSVAATVGTAFGGTNSSKKEVKTFGSNEKAKAYFKDRLKALENAVEGKITEFSNAGKFGEHKDWQHTLIMQAPKKDIALVASPVKFFSRAGSATKQFFAPFFRRSASAMSMASGGEQSTNGPNLSGHDLNSQIVEPGGDMSQASNGHSWKLDSGSVK